MHIRCVITFDVGAPKTVKLPKPPFFKVGFCAFAVLFLVTAGVFFVPTDPCDEFDDDWLKPPPVFFGKRTEGRLGRTPP